MPKNNPRFDDSFTPLGNERQLGLLVDGKGLKLRKLPNVDLWVCGFGFGSRYRGLEKCGKRYREAVDSNGRPVMIEAHGSLHQHPSPVLVYPPEASNSLSQEPILLLENENPPNLSDEAVLPSQPSHSSSQSSSAPQNGPIDPIV